MSVYDARVDGVQDIISYQFGDRTLAIEALHVPGSGLSFYILTGRHIADGNKRLALLGDAILKTALSDAWYGTGESRASINARISNIGSNTNLANAARNTGIDDHIVAHPGQFGQFGNGTLADTIEAIIGAVWKDSHSLAVVTSVLQRLGLT